MDNFQKNLGLHFIYIVLILLIFIIFLVSDRWSDKDGFTSYLSNAATFTSLVLGLVAIFYSFIANESISKSIGEVTQSSKDIENLSKDFSSTKNSIDETKISSLKIKDEISHLIEELHGKIESLDKSVEDIVEYRDHLSKAINDGFTQVHAELGGLRGGNQINTGDDLIKDGVSFNFLCALYAISLSFKEKKKMNIFKIFNDDIKFFYFLGVVNSLKFCKKIKIEEEDFLSNNKEEWEISFKEVELNQKIIETAIEKLINDNKNQKFKKSWSETLEKINKNLYKFSESNENK